MIYVCPKCGSSSSGNDNIKLETLGVCLKCGHKWWVPNTGGQSDDVNTRAFTVDSTWYMLGDSWDAVHRLILVELSIKLPDIKCSDACDAASAIIKRLKGESR